MKTAKFLLLHCLAAFLSIALLTSCHMKRLRGKGNKSTNNIPVGAFHALEVDVSLNTDITFKPGVQPSLQISGYENILAHIKTQVEDGTLRIYTDLDSNWTLDKRDGTTAHLILPALDSIAVQGASDVNLHGNLTGREFAAIIVGAGSLIADSVNADTFYTEISGAADVAIHAGRVQKLVYDISGAGKVASFPLVASDAEVTISGAGKVDLTANKTLLVEIDGAGKVKYKGNAELTKDISGAGLVRKVD